MNNNYAEKYFKFLENEKAENPCDIIRSLIKSAGIKHYSYISELPNHPAYNLENWILFAKSPDFCIEFASNYIEHDTKLVKKSFLEKGFPSYEVFKEKWLEYSKVNPHLALKYVFFSYRLRQNTIEREKDLEEVISKNDQCSYSYAKDFLKGRFILGEKSIFQNPETTIKYLVDIFGLGKSPVEFPSTQALPEEIVESVENIVSTHSEAAYLYSYLTNKRFEKGEKAISESPEYSFLYAKNILKSRFEMGEKAISKSDEFCFKYAAGIVGGSLPKKMHEFMQLKGFQKV